MGLFIYLVVRFKEEHKNWTLRYGWVGFEHTLCLQILNVRDSGLGKLTSYSII